MRMATPPSTLFGGLTGILYLCWESVNSYRAAVLFSRPSGMATVAPRQSLRVVTDLRQLGFIDRILNASKRPLVINNHTYCACWLNLAMALLPRLQALISTPGQYSGLCSVVRESACL